MISISPGIITTDSRRRSRSDTDIKLSFQNSDIAVEFYRGEVSAVMLAQWQIFTNLEDTYDETNLEDCITCTTSSETCWNESFPVPLPYSTRSRSRHFSCSFNFGEISSIPIGMFSK